MLKQDQGKKCNMFHVDPVSVGYKKDVFKEYSMIVGRFHSYDSLHRGDTKTDYGIFIFPSQEPRSERRYKGCLDSYIKTAGLR